jgi:hypothetical protein
MATASAAWHRVVNCVCLLIAVLLVLNLSVVQALLSGMPRPLAAAVVAFMFAAVGGITYWVTGERETAKSPEGTPHLIPPATAPLAGPGTDTTPPKPSVTVTAEGPYIVVRNTGGPATFRAHLLVTHAQEFPSVSDGSRFEAIWESTLSERSEIVTGDADRLLIGPVAGDHDPSVTYFHFYDVATQKMGGRMARHVPNQGAPVLSFDLTLVSLPALAGGPKTYDFSLFPGRVEFLMEKQY